MFDLNASSYIFLAAFMCVTQLAFAILKNTPPDSTNYEQDLKEGIEAFYQTDWPRAATIFNKLQQQAPKDSRAYFFQSMIPFWKYYFAENSPQAATAFLKQSQNAITISQNQLKENPQDTTMVLMLSGLYGYRSLVAASEKEYRTAMQSGITGFKYTRQLLVLDNDDPNALIGKGMFYYMIGSVPSELKWMTNMAGLSGNIQEGFDALELAANSESYVSNDAKMILAYLYERENNEQKALSHLKDLVQKYPENIIFQYNLARLHEKCTQIAEARAKFEHVLSMKAVGLQSLKEKSRERLQDL